MLRDSIYIRESRAGDTVFLTKTVTRLRYRDRLVRDTVYRARTDTVRHTDYAWRWRGRRPWRWLAAAALLCAAAAALRAFLKRAKKAGA